MTYQDLEVLYETNHLIVVIKPAGILSQKDATGDLDMMMLVKEYLKEKYQKKGNVFLGLVHRLDRMTSGIMVFAKTSKGASRLCSQINEGKFIKKYIAKVEGEVPAFGTLENFLIFDESSRKAFVKDSGKKAILSYERLFSCEEFSYVLVSLLTGRHHQIRVQFAHFNHPLYGDVLYGTRHKENLKLHACYLSFLDPVTNERIEFENEPSWYERNLYGK